MAANNTTTKKRFPGGEREMPQPALAQKDVNYGNRKGKYEGQASNYEHEKYAEPLNKGAPARISGLDGLHDDIGEKSGFTTEGYLDKANTPFGEAAKFNFMPPGMDISNQENAEIHEMPLRVYTGGESYPDDGWMPKPRDVEE